MANVRDAVATGTVIHSSSAEEFFRKGGLNKIDQGYSFDEACKELGLAKDTVLAALFHPLRKPMATLVNNRLRSNNLPAVSAPNRIKKRYANPKAAMLHTNSNKVAQFIREITAKSNTNKNGLVPTIIPILKAEPMEMTNVVTIHGKPADVIQKFADISGLTADEVVQTLLDTAGKDLANKIGDQILAKVDNLYKLVNSANVSSMS